MANLLSEKPAYMHVLDEMQRLDANGEWNTRDSWGTYANIKYVIEVLSEWQADDPSDNEISALLREAKRWQS